MKLLLLLVLASACIRQAPPVAPVLQPTPVVESSARAEHTQALVEVLTAKIPVLGKCERWGSDDTRLCQPTPTTLMWCTAPEDGSKPRCELAADWTPPAVPSEPATPAPAAALPKGKPKK